MKPAVNIALSRDGMYAKSQLYIRRAIRARDAGDLDEYQLWASLAVELLGKAALAAVHPCLVADPTHIYSLFAACGIALSPDIKTIGARTVFERLGHIDRRFDKRDQTFCEQLALRRNSELHSGESPFVGMTLDTWEQKYWGACERLLAMQNSDFKLWLGKKEAKGAERLAEEEERAIDLAVNNRVERCREDFSSKYKDPKQREKIIAESATKKWARSDLGFDLSLDKVLECECPACGALGVLGGSEWTETVTGTDVEDETVEFVDKTYVVEEFCCPYCDLHLAGNREVKAAGLPDEFVVQDVRERVFEEDYGNC